MQMRSEHSCLLMAGMGGDSFPLRIPRRRRAGANTGHPPEKRVIFFHSAIS